MINPIHAASKLKDFMESFDGGVEYLSDNLQKCVKQFVEEGTLTEPENFVGEKKPTAGDIHKYMDPNGFLKQFENMAMFFKTALLLPRTTSNIERDFLVMNLFLRC